MDIQNDVKNYIVDNILFGEEFKFEAGDSFQNNGILDSIGFLELITFVEEKYGIFVEDSEVVPENFDSLENIAKYVEQKMNMKKLLSLNIDLLSQNK